MANRAVDLVITYRLIKLLITPFEKQDAFKLGIIDKDGFVFNLKRILKRVGLGGRLGSFAVALGLLLKENKHYLQHKNLMERAVITYLKDTNQFVDLLKEEGDVPDYIINKEPAYTCFGIDVYEKDGHLYSEKEYAQKL